MINQLSPLQELIHKNKIGIGISILLIINSINGFAQYDDSAVYRVNKVKHIESWVHFLQFENSNDTCLFEVKEVNQKGFLTFVKQDYMCYGSQVVSETKFEYDANDRVSVVTSTQNDNLISQTKLFYNAAGKIVREETKVIEPYLMQIITHQYFGPSKTPDSLISVQINNGDTTQFKTIFTYKNGKQTRAEMVDITNNQPVSKHVNKYDSKGRMIRDEFILMQSYDNDDITNFTYNEKGQIFRSQSEISKIAAEFYYGKSGLLSKTFYYNKFETLEREVWHKYTYWK